MSVIRSVNQAHEKACCGRRVASTVLAMVISLAGCGGKAEETKTTRPSAVVQQQTAVRCSEARERIRRVNPDLAAYRGEGKASEGMVAITAGDFFFSPTCITSAKPTAQTAREPVMLTVKNDSKNLHNVTVPDQKIDMNIPPGQTVSVPVRAVGPNLIFFCKFHQSSGMQGVLVPGGA